MEKAPWGTFQDELDWCIQQLQANLLMHGTPREAEENSHVLNVLQSKTTTSAKKRQVMQMLFGDYRQKMMADHKAQKDTVRSSEGTGFSWTPSNNSFVFNFFPDGTAGQPEDSVASALLMQESGNQMDSVLLTGQGAGFAFNFQIPARPPETESKAGLGSSAGAVAAAAGSRNGGDGGFEDLQGPERSSKAAKKKNPKSKKKKGNASDDQRKGGEESRDEAAGCSVQSMMTSEEQLVRELDWCVEQLELGLRTQKCTSKQMEEASRALRTLRSSKAPLVKKRQVMRAMFGDYRKKMEEDKAKQVKQIKADMKSARVAAVVKPVKEPVFHRKAECRKPIQDQKPSTKSKDTSPEPNGKGFVFSPTEEVFCFNFF